MDALLVFCFVLLFALHMCCITYLLYLYLILFYLICQSGKDRG